MRIDAVEYGALGDGITDDSKAIFSAILAAGHDGAVQLTAGSVFRIASTLTLPAQLTILGAGAILLSDTLNAPALRLAGEGCIVEGLHLIGPPLSIDLAPKTFPRSVAIEIRGAGSLVSSCRFEGYTYGGVRVHGSRCRVLNNHFTGVRNYSELGTPDWLGVIYITENDNIVSGNLMEEVWDSGIQVMGGSRNLVSNNKMIFSLHPNAANSMGMRINRDSQNNIFSANMVRYARQESISLAAPKDVEVCGNIVADNILLDGGWAGIALAAMGGNVNRNIIRGNSIRAVENVWDLGIILNTRRVQGVMHNLIEGNMLYGEMVDGKSQLQRGIHLFGSGTHGNQIISNRVTNVRHAGIDCAGSDTLVTGNYLDGCATGINATYCPGSMITANMVRHSRMASIRILNNVEGLVVRGNTLDMLEALAVGATKPRGTYVMEDNFVV